MADIETDLVTALEGTALAGSRVYPGRWPQDVTWPALTYELIARTPEHAIDRTVGCWRDRWQIDIWAETQAAVVALTQQVVAALLAFHGTAQRTVALAIQDVRGRETPTDSLWARIVEVVIVYV